MAPGAVVRFRGVRSAPSPGADRARFGGHSSCIEVAANGRVLILDAGSGLRDLGADLAGGGPVDGDILFSRTMIFRMIGLPFFAAAYSPGSRLTLHSGSGKVRSELARMMSDPVFPTTPDIFRAEVTFHDFLAGETIRLGPDVEAATIALGGASPGTAYRLTGDGWSLAWILAAGGDDDPEELASLARGADLLVTSGGEHRAADLARRSGAGRLMVTDHPPGTDDDELEERDNVLRRLCPHARLARDGDVVTLGR